jgi:cellulose synthase/poly-beta-1,6-N-acetylglucosamine synthase-like glycosyltransferase
MTQDDCRAVPFTSVIVPVYNDRRRIGFCLAALLDQTYPGDRYEVIVVAAGRPVSGRGGRRRVPCLAAPSAAGDSPAYVLQDTLTETDGDHEPGVEVAKG